MPYARQISCGLFSLALLGTTALTMQEASAAPIIQLTSQLTGDIRPSNPDNLVIDVSITVDSASQNVAHWVVDINSPMHPNANLDEFYFNIVGSSANYLVQNIAPAYIASSPGTPIGFGNGNPSFSFQIADPNGPGQSPNVTNSTVLSFDLRKVSGAYAITDFTGAATNIGGDGLSGQLGAHLRSLCPTSNGCTSTSASGFATGNYTTTPPVAVPEPATLALLGSGLLGLGMMRRRKNDA